MATKTVVIPNLNLLLDLDKPLAGQPERVRQILRSSGWWSRHRAAQKDPQEHCRVRRDTGKGLCDLIISIYESRGAVEGVLGRLGIIGTLTCEGDCVATLWDTTPATPTVA